MKRKRHTPSQIIAKLREADKALAGGASVGQVCKQLGISEQTYYRWRNEYGSMTSDQARRLKELERENTKLKRIVAEQAMDNDSLKELLRKNW
jgi:transposase-like protein